MTSGLAFIPAILGVKLGAVSCGLLEQYLYNVRISYDSLPYQFNSLSILVTSLSGHSGDTDIAIIIPNNLNV